MTRSEAQELADQYRREVVELTARIKAWRTKWEPYSDGPLAKLVTKKQRKAIEAAEEAFARAIEL